MEPKQLKRLADNWRRADQALIAAREALGAALLAEADAGTPQKDVVEATGVNRETVRLMVKKAREDRGVKTSNAAN